MALAPKPGAMWALLSLISLLILNMMLNIRSGQDTSESDVTSTVSCCRYDRIL